VAIDEAKARGGVVGKLKRAGLGAAAALAFVRLYLQPVQKNAAPALVRLAPAW
jgi:magnesium-protoporphyrin IX monomethyl ester (oxidative) cyclase